MGSLFYVQGVQFGHHILNVLGLLNFDVLGRFLALGLDHLDAPLIGLVLDLFLLFFWALDF